MTQAPPTSPVVLPTREDQVARNSLGWMGGPVGLLARLGVSWLSPLRVVVAVTTLAYALGFLLDKSCRDEQWRSPERYEHLCYSDIPPLYFLRGFADGLIPYAQAMPNGQHLEYPVLTGVFMQTAAQLTRWLEGILDAEHVDVLFFDVNVLLLFIALLVAVIATALTVRRRPWDALMVALAPTLILGATINWDLLPLAFIGLALLAWARRHPFVAGILLGLAVAAKFYPLVLLGGFFVLALRTARWRAFGALVGGTLVAWLTVNLPVMLTSFDGWSYFYTFSSERGQDFGSIWFMLSESGIAEVPRDSLNTLAMGAFLALCVAIAVLALAAPKRPRLVSILFLVVAAFALTNKVYSPQYSLWLIPLAVMARPRWRDFLVWQAGEVIYFLGIWWFLVAYGNEGEKGLNGQEYAVAILIHVLATLYLVAFVVRDILQPGRDPVRTDGFTEDMDDPGGGVFDGAEDRVTLGRARHRSATS
jgi:uncharacterized membrane protein